jgi:uncharacterized membrane protein
MKPTKINLFIPITLVALSLSASVDAQPPRARHRMQVRGATATTTQTTKAAQTTQTYSFTLVSYPSTLNTLGVGINLGAVCPADAEPNITVVGAEFTTSSQTGFAAHVYDTNIGVNEHYQLLNDPHAPQPQQAYSVNDYGEIVGDYIDAAGVFHSYVLENGVYRSFDVPFAGATGTYSPAVNNSGEIVGTWNDSAGNAHGYTLVAGKFQSFDVPGSSQAQFYYGINSAGDIAGTYLDAGGNSHGFVRRGTTYTSLDVPGATYTAASGINDAGEVVGGFCLTAECASTGYGQQGFVLRDGVYATFTIAGEATVALASIDNAGVVMGNYLDAAGLVYTFLATPEP